METKETVLITGANSFIAKHLVNQLKDKFNIKLLTRAPRANNEYFWDISIGKIDEKAFDDVQYIVHLAGSKLNDGTPLTEERKKLVYESRIGATDLIRTTLKSRNQKLKAFVSASAIGYYGFSETKNEIDESGYKGLGFAADLSADWEKAADLLKSEGVANHVSKIRVSLVLGSESGILPIYMQMVDRNSAIATESNDQVFLWNHIEDMAGIFAFAVENQLDGVYNSVAPQPASVQHAFQVISNELNQTAFALKPFKGQHLVSNKIMHAGYVFKFPNIQLAIHDLMQQK